jgi:hypothetical protein
MGSNALHNSSNHRWRLLSCFAIYNYHTITPTLAVASTKAIVSLDELQRQLPPTIKHDRHQADKFQKKAPGTKSASPSLAKLILNNMDFLASEMWIDSIHLTSPAQSTTP